MPALPFPAGVSEKRFVRGKKVGGGDVVEVSWKQKVRGFRLNFKKCCVPEDEDRGKRAKGKSRMYTNKGIS